jgi:type II secretory pathway pseudopilin PulG
MCVIAIMAVVAVFIAPAFTALKSAGDVTSAAYTIKGLLEQARTYAIANNTYTWVGFADSVGSNTTAVTGQVSIAIVGSNDGTKFVCAVNPTDTTRLGTDSTTASAMVVGSGPGSVTQLGKLTKLSNAHIGDTGTPTNDGTDFESRPSVQSFYRVSASGDTAHPFTVQQTTFNRWIQFATRGEVTVKGGNTQVNQYAEVGLLPTHGSNLAVSYNANTNTYTGNVVAIQLTGNGGNVRIYRR